MRRRRGIVALSLVSSAAMGVIALYQTGIIEHLPDLPLPRADADTVDASAEAYSRFDTPDAVLGLGSYAATMALAAMGGVDRTTETPWVPLAMAGKIAFDVANAVRLTIDQFVQQKAFCTLCLTAAAATFAMLPLAVPETVEAMRAVGRRIEGRAASTKDCG